MRVSWVSSCASTPNRFRRNYGNDNTPQICDAFNVITHMGQTGNVPWFDNFPDLRDFDTKFLVSSGTRPAAVLPCSSPPMLWQEITYCIRYFDLPLFSCRKSSARKLQAFA